MKLIHTADLHLGQILYQNYDREDEHAHFFQQLKAWCRAEKPDALVVSGDIFDIQQPSASTKRFFNESFVGLAKDNPDMAIVIAAGNHDSASRIQADSPVWDAAGVRLVGTAPAIGSTDLPDGWQDKFIVRLKSGYIIALPYMIGERPEVIQNILEKVEAENEAGKPVVLMAHAAITGTDMQGHGEIGKMRTQGIQSMGHGWDYLALGHIHKPQTLGHAEDALKDEAVTYPSGVARYSGSALHVSCDETYPHSVSVVEIPAHGSDVTIRPLRIDELRHFFILPDGGKGYASEEEALAGVKDFCDNVGQGYFRLCVDAAVSLSSNFNKKVYDILAPYGEEVRFNPKTIWVGETKKEEVAEKPVFEVAELQQMEDPVDFIEKTRSQYHGLPDEDELRKLFDEVRDEIKRFEDEAKQKEAQKAAKKKAQADQVEENEDQEE